MLYLFGRLALSDSYYFNDDFHADDYSDQKREPSRPAPVATSSPAPSAPHETALPAVAAKIAA